jgi:hypothetical protein
MEIITYTHEQKYIERYCDLLSRLYSEDERITAQLAEIKKQLSDNNPFYKYGKIVNFIALRDDEVVGHCSAIIDSRNSNIGLIGFYDVINDESISNELLDNAITYMKSEKCSVIRGPTNLTIWHNYRFIVKNKRAPDIFDPFSKNYYHDFWLKKGFKVASQYVSAIRTNFNHVIPHTKAAYENCIKEGYHVRRFKKENNDLDNVLNMANAIFEDSWNYVALSYEEFNYLYEDLLNKIDTKYFEIVEDKDNKPIAFCFTIINPYHDDQIILKTIGVLKEHRNNHIAAALLYKQHLTAQKEGFSEFYYPLIRVGNNVTKFPYQGYEIITEYVAFELK